MSTGFREADRRQNAKANALAVALREWPGGLVGWRPGLHTHARVRASAHVNTT